MNFEFYYHNKKYTGSYKYKKDHPSFFINDGDSIKVIFMKNNPSINQLVEIKPDSEKIFGFVPIN